MNADVGKTHRRLQEVRRLQMNGMDLKVGFIETHDKKEAL